MLSSLSSFSKEACQHWWVTPVHSLNGGKTDENRKKEGKTGLIFLSIQYLKQNISSRAIPFHSLEPVFNDALEANRLVIWSNKINKYNHKYAQFYLLKGGALNRRLFSFKPPSLSPNGKQIWLTGLFWTEQRKTKIAEIAPDCLKLSLCNFLKRQRHNCVVNIYVVSFRHSYLLWYMIPKSQR